MTPPAAPNTGPYRIAEDTWLIPRLAPAGPQGFVFLNSMLIRGEQPIIVDTGAPVHREQWCNDVFGLVSPADVRWVFVSHDDVDHVGNLDVVLDSCPNATVVTDFLGFMRLSVLCGLPPTRARWLNAGESLDVGDRTLTAVRPPLYDASTTRGLLDQRTGVMWGADCFAAPTPDTTCEAADVAGWRDSFVPFNSMENPWHAWLDPTVYGEHVDAVRALGSTVWASCHGPVLRGERLEQAFEMTRGIAGAPPVPPPGQLLLDQIVAEAMAAAATAAVPGPREPAEPAAAVPIG